MTSAEQFTISTGKSSVSCGPDQKMLDAFLRNGVWVPNSCNQGTCGTCKVRVVRGSVDHPPAPDSVLSVAEQEQGFVLSCQTTPTWTSNRPPRTPAHRATCFATSPEPLDP